MLIALETLVDGEGWSLSADPEQDRLFPSFGAPEFRWHVNSNGDVSVEMMAAQFLEMVERHRVTTDVVAARIRTALPEHD